MVSETNPSFDFSAIPEDMRGFKNWVLWKYEPRKDNPNKPAKVPYRTRTQKARVSNPVTWSNLDYVIRQITRYPEKFDGIGFVFSENTGLVGVDFDHIRVNETGEIDPVALEEIRALNSYTEISPSGTGVHVICKGVMPAAGRRQDNREMYSDSHFLTFTGDKLPDTPTTINEAQEAINTYYEKWFSKSTDDKTLSNEAKKVVKSLKASKKLGAKFKRLFDGDISDYDNDQSRADIALMGMVYRGCKDRTVTIEIFKASKLGEREKAKREDYITRTIENVIQNEAYGRQTRKNAGVETEEDRDAEEDIDEDEAKFIDTDIDERDVDPALIAKAERLAERILSHGNPIKYIMKTVARKHVGDVNTIEAIALAIGCQSCQNTSGIQVSVNGESGSGKSHGLKVYMHLVPAADKRKGSLSSKSAYYMDLKPGTAIYSDDTDPDESMQEVIKRSTTNYQEYTFHYTVKDQSGVSVAIPPRINWFLTSVESHVSDQVLNRQLVFETDSSYKQKKAINEVQKRELMRGENETEVNLGVLICRRMHANLKEVLFKVKIPFADRIELDDVSNSRILPLFADMIMGYTLWHWKQRTIDTDGKLLATEEDFHKAKMLFVSRAENTVTKLTKNESKIIKSILEHGEEGATMNEIADDTGLDYGTVQRIILGRKDRNTKGLMGKVKGLRQEHLNETEYDRDAVGTLIKSKGRKADRIKLTNYNYHEIGRAHV